MPTTPVPSYPNLEFYRKQAKALLRAARQSDAEAIACLRRWLPRLSNIEDLPPDLALHDVQLTVAREHGFASWPLLRAHVISAQGNVQKRFRPHVLGFQWYEERIAGVLSMHQAGLPETLEEIRLTHPRFVSATDDEIRVAVFTEDDARLLLAREHGFKDWDEFRTHVETIQSGTRVEPFTAAFEAIKSGDIITISNLLKNHSDLLEAQGTNGSSLLNLAVSLKQPMICRLLLDSEVDPDLATTRGVTPLHQAAYSNQSEIIEILIEAGASPQTNAYGDGGTPLVMALFWGHDHAREVLARHAIIPENLRVAAGVGRLDLVKTCFRANGALTDEAIAHRCFYRPHTGFPIWSPSSTRQEILDEAFVYASRNGQIGVLGFLLAIGADFNGDPYRGTALTWAAWNGRADVIHWLLDHGADINHRATFGGSAHGQGFTALHAAAQTGRLNIAKLLVEHGGDPGIRDDLYSSPAWGWAEYHKHFEVKDYLQSKGKINVY